MSEPKPLPTLHLHVRTEYFEQIRSGASEVAAGAPGSVTEPLHAYLARNIANGVIDFRIRAQLTPGGDVGFYIHPAHVSGDTRDYIIGGDIEAGEGWDFLFNAQRVPEPDVETFRRQLHASSQNTQAES